VNPFTIELIAIARAFGVFERETVCCGTVTVPQCVVLQELLEEPRDISRLADRVGVSMSAMTRLVDGLERRAWVSRTRSIEDRRKVVVELTAGGRREAARLRALSQQLVDTILARIPAEKHAQVLESVRLVRLAMAEFRDDLTRLSSAACG
jgi:DNA-binding MarR family transcriptional regulator